MKQSFKAFAVLFALIVLAATALAQNDARRTTVAITYPLNQTIEVAFHGTTRLPRLKGTAKVKRQGRRGTRVELSLENLPRAYELGEPRRDAISARRPIMPATISGPPCLSA